MKYCEKCGNKMDDDSIFCSKCGRKFVLIEDEDNNSGTILTNNMISDDSTNRISVAKNKTKLNKRIFAIVIFAVIAVLVTFGSVWIVYLFFGPQETPESVAEFKASCSYYEYDMIARRPKDYEGKHAVIDGKVLQVVSENNSLYQLRVGEINDTDRVYYVEYKTKNDDENRILKNDKIRFYGIYRNLIDVETTFGEKKSVLAFEAKYIEFLDSSVVSNQSSVQTTSNTDESMEASRESTSEVSKVKETSETSQKQELSNNDSNTPKETLLDFSKLIETNPDTVGWIKVPNSVIDYVVVKPPEDDPEYYVKRDFYGDQSNYGTIFLDSRSQLDSKNIILHGHNMQDGRMFSSLKNYLDLGFYKTTPTFTFNTIYEKNDWKVISVFKTNTMEAQGEVFNYLRGSFESDYDFLDFVYNLRVRSVIDCPVSVNENDILVTLSTPCYDMEDFRLVIVARRVRDGEKTSVDVAKAKINSQPLYPDGWYSSFGGTKPTVTSFQKAFKNNKINWYDGNSTWKSEDDNELQKVLTEGKENAKRMLRESYNKNDYETEQQQEIESIINKYMEQINNATVANDVNKLYAAAINEINNVKTKKQLAGLSSQAAPVKLYADKLFDYNGVTYYTPSFSGKGDTGNLDFSALGNKYKALTLPDMYDSYGRQVNIDSFIIVGDVVYFTDQEAGSVSPLPAKLYMMNLDGSACKLIAEDVDVRFYCEGNIIYFASCYSSDDSYTYSISSGEKKYIGKRISLDNSDMIFYSNDRVEYNGGIYYKENLVYYREDKATGSVQVVGHSVGGGQQ